MRVRTIAMSAVLLTLASVAPAQSVAKLLTDDFRNAGKDIIGVWVSPFDASARDWAFAAASFGAFGLAMFADQEASDWAIRNDSSAAFKVLGPLRRGGVLFSGKYVVPPVAALYVVGLAIKNQNMRDFVTGCMSSWVAQGAVRRVAASTFGRARPDSMPNDPQHWGIGEGRGEWSMRSFPAGHFANAMGCASFANNRFQMGIVEPVLYAVAVGVGVGRMPDKAHWLSDTVIGGILGYAVGKEVARRSLSREVVRATAAGGSGPGLQVAPGAGGVDINLRWTF